MSVLQANVVPHVHRLGSSLVNWYVVADGDRLTVVDAGLPRFTRELERDLHELGHRTGDVEAVLLTHSDADHTGVAAALRDAGARVYIHGYDQETLARPGPKGGDARMGNVVRQLWRPQAWRTLGHMARRGGGRPRGSRGPSCSRTATSSTCRAARASCTRRATRPGTARSCSPTVARCSWATPCARSTRCRAGAVRSPSRTR